MAFDHCYNYADSETGELYVPITVSATARSIEVEAVFDTGAEYCVFERGVAERLGLDVESGSRKRFRTVAGRFDTYEHPVVLNTLGIEFETYVCFARDPQMDRVRLGIVHYDRELYLSPYDE